MAAIYQWESGGVQILTTTLYPIELKDSVQLSISFSDGSLREIITEEIDVTASFLGGSLVETLITYGPDDEEIDVNAFFLGGTLEQLLLEYNADDEEVDVTTAFLGGTLVFRLVTIDTPDEALQLACDINALLCTMTEV